MSEVVTNERKIDIKVEHVGEVEYEVHPVRAKSTDFKIGQVSR